MAQKIEIYPCGTMVHFTILDVEAMITSINIRFGRVQYELSYPCEGQYRTTWVAVQEFTCMSPVKKQSIGFKK